jgi:hypothetical protein
LEDWSHRYCIPPGAPTESVFRAFGQPCAQHRSGTQHIL